MTRRPNNIYGKNPVNIPMETSSGGAGAFGEDGEAFVADFGEAASDRNAFGLRALAPVDRDLAVLERGHVRRMAGHDAGLAFGAGDDDHVDVVGNHQPVRRDELEMQIGHY